MLYSTRTPEQKRRELRELLASGRTVQFPGAFNPLSARLIEEKGFDGVYISGAVLANDLGLPDIACRPDRPDDGSARTRRRRHRLR